MAVAGSLNYDLTFYLAQRPRFGESVLARDLQRDLGGKGFNQAVALRRLGAEVEMVGAVGDDPFGSEFERRLDELGIGRQGVIRVQAPTGIAAPMVDESGENENAIVVALGANRVIEPAQLRAESFAGTAAVLLQGELRPDTTLEAARLARAAGALVAFNIAPAEPGFEHVVKAADVVIVNRGEAAFFGGPASLLAMGARSVVVTLGAEGAELHGARAARVPAPKVEVVDTTGAGDAFSAAYVTALVEGRAPEAALRFGVAAGAAAVTRAGTSRAMPERSLVEEIYRAWAKTDSTRG